MYIITIKIIFFKKSEIGVAYTFGRNTEVDVKIIDNTVTAKYISLGKEREGKEHERKCFNDKKVCYIIGVSAINTVQDVYDAYNHF